jgi:hypothetical protein
MIDMINSVFLVDGVTEIRAVREKFTSEFRCTPDLRKVDCNGKDVTPDGYANAAYGTLILALKDRFSSIVCIVDREGRRASAADFAYQIKTAIVRKVGESTRYHKRELQSKIHVCVPDRMFENWIVSDVEGIMTNCDLVDQNASQGKYEGKSGTTELKRIMIVSYKKTLHGPKLFGSTRFEVSKNNSISFQIFASIIGI